MRINATSANNIVLSINSTNANYVLTYYRTALTVKVVIYVAYARLTTIPTKPANAKSVPNLSHTASPVSINLHVSHASSTTSSIAIKNVWNAHKKYHFASIVIQAQHVNFVYLAIISPKTTRSVSNVLIVCSTANCVHPLLSVPSVGIVLVLNKITRHAISAVKWSITVSHAPTFSFVPNATLNFYTPTKLYVGYVAMSYLIVHNAISNSDAPNALITRTSAMVDYAIYAPIV